MCALPNRKTILVVDDEATPRDLISRILKQNDFEVLVAASGAAAIELVSAHGATIDLVTLDIIMPELGGEETFLAIHYLQPKLPFLIITGGDENETVHRLLLSGYCAKLAKPFTVTTLMDKILWMLVQYPR